jgi:uncharacterized membrane protein YebE (DUF533 family)
MSEEAFGKRRHALEESFFEKKNRDLLEKLQQQVQTEESVSALSQASGITNEGVLKHLVALEIGPEAVAAMSMVPLVAVAWADGHMDKKERDAILKAADEQGLCRISGRAPEATYKPSVAVRGLQRHVRSRQRAYNQAKVTAASAQR